MELTDAARGRGIIERWCVLAEQRLDYLTELFESGRWRRYFGEVTFLENIQEAKQAVETWRGLLNREATLDNRPIDLSWLGRRSTLPPRQVSYLDDAAAPAPIAEALAAPAPLPAQPSKPSIPVLKLVVAPQTQPEPSPPSAPSAPVDELPWDKALDPEILQQRYPLLRNAF